MENKTIEPPEGITIDAYYNVLFASLTLEEKRAIAMILLALEKAKRKHPEPWAVNKKSKAYDHCYAAGIVGEEAGELLQRALQHEHEGLDRNVEMLHEATHTGATVIRFIVNTIKNQNKQK